MERFGSNAVHLAGKWWGRIAYALGQSCTIVHLKSRRERHWAKAGNFFVDSRSGTVYKAVLFVGPLTQSVEYLPFKQRVVGSSPTRPTNFILPTPPTSPSSSLVQDTGLSRRQQGFKSPWGRQRIQSLALFKKAAREPKRFSGGFFVFGDWGIFGECDGREAGSPSIQKTRIAPGNPCRRAENFQRRPPQVEPADGGASPPPSGGNPACVTSSGIPKAPGTG